ncbi:MAG: sugar phosphate isomerase/epimerase [Fimbriimonadales bacterium]|nr:sugar phosphate isomerase/epimerase [Fimbriimonadales bacterium]MDW8052324.1 sugar phosphate isomerase/epimerase family protein [Armatimonadota bacterium]
MAKPKIAWAPVRLIQPILHGQLTVLEWLRQVPAFGVSAVELYYAFLSQENLPQLKAELRALELAVSQITCAPDFTHPDPAVRAAQLEMMKRYVDWAAELGADAVRTTAGTAHEGVNPTDAVHYAAENMVKLAEYAIPQGVYPCYENHYKDRLWTREDFSFLPERFLAIFELLEPTPVRINFDFANPLMVDADPVALLQRVVHKVHHVHAGDRLPGQYQHTVLGEGAVPFVPLLQLLKAHGYAGYISIEDGQPYGDEGFRKSLAFLKSQVDAVWGAE